MDQNREGLSALRTSDRHDPLSFEQACQMELESEALTHGSERFTKAVQRNKETARETNNQAGLKALKDSIEPVAIAMQNFLDMSEHQKGVKHVAIRIIKEIGPEHASLLTAKAILDTLSSSSSVSKMTFKIANMILDELRFRKFKTVAPGLFEWKMARFDTTSYAHMKRSLDASINFADVDVSEYVIEDSLKVNLGTKCLDLFIRATHKTHVDETGEECTGCYNNGYVQKETWRQAKSKQVVVVATQNTMDWVARIERDLLFMAPTYRPTLIQPKPWTNVRDGGYWFGLKNHFKLLRTDGRHQLTDLNSIDMPVVYDALNAIQDTSWSINKRVLEVITTLRSRERAPNGVIPSDYDEPLPPRTAIMQVDEDVESVLFAYIQAKRKKTALPKLPQGWDAERVDAYSLAVKKWRKAAGIVRNRNHVRRVKALVLSCTVATASLMIESTEETNGQFYFPHNLDFRGRAYAIPLYLQPQGDDLQKGLLQFGIGKRLGTPGAVEWFAVHGANCLADAPGGRKLDKLPFAERVQWIHDHSDEIRGVAEDPIANDWWTAADSPFCFLAFCYEWAGYLREGLNYVSYLPIAMDGSCNGLQHYSALLRDEVGGKAVNLTPSTTPQDIYAKVAEKVVAMLRASDDPLALDWIKWGKVDRKFVKRQVMTLPYGSKKFGFKKQITQFVLALDREEQPEFMTGEDSEGGFQQFNFIAQIIWDALAGTVTAATSGMEWLQSLARICAKEDLPICWQAPNGLPVVQGYREEIMKRVETTLCAVRYQPAYHEAQKTLDRNKQVSGIAPNVVHSLDASAMMLTTVAAKAEGIEHFAMIHDSYGTHAADAEKLARITRECFVKMYQENDILGMIETSLMANVDLTKVKDYPVRPVIGNLDLNAVKESKYFFS